VTPVTGATRAKGTERAERAGRPPSADTPSRRLERQETRAQISAGLLMPQGLAGPAQWSGTFYGALVVAL
jgi:hypothetical protein